MTTKGTNFQEVKVDQENRYFSFLVLEGPKTLVNIQERGGYCMSTSATAAAAALNPRTFRRSLLSL